MNSIILRVALPTPLQGLFDYLPGEGIDNKRLIRGVRVCVPFGSRNLIGILIEIAQKSSVEISKLKQIIEVIDDEPLFSPDIYRLCEWAADYYHHSLGEIMASAMPALLRKGKKLPQVLPSQSLSQQVIKLPVLNTDQQAAVQKICAAKNSFKTILLDGITGSGKTEVYLRAIADTLADGKQILVLVPEISLTPQTIARFQERFSVPIVSLHSGLSDKKRLNAWACARSGDAKIMIGTRSAIFTPFSKLGLIIIDEEHDSSFKQQERFRYHARDLAVLRASFNQVPIVLGSATPSLESLLNVKRDRYVSLSLPMRAGGAVLPRYEMVDTRPFKLDSGLSPPLLDEMRKHLGEGNQVMLFLNRRGFAPVLYCVDCHFIAVCKHCDARLVYHRKPLMLKCHHCDQRHALPTHCTQCHNTQLQPVGLGTQRLEETLAKHFPAIPIIRVDRDTTERKDAMQNLLADIHSQKPSILLGTQMLAKGHHFPQVTLVGIVDADSGLFSADFRAGEQMGQLLLQVSGRAGRAEQPGTVVIQTRHPDHPLLQTLIYDGYHAFSDTLLLEREQNILPPYSYFAVMRVEARQADNASHFLNNIKDISKNLSEEVKVLGPVRALISKRKGLHCQHLLFKSNRRSSLQGHLKSLVLKINELISAKRVRWILDVDPIEV